MLCVESLYVEVTMYVTLWWCRNKWWGGWSGWDRDAIHTVKTQNHRHDLKLLVNYVLKSLPHSVVKWHSRLLNFHEAEGLVNHRVKKEWSKSTVNLIASFYPTLIFALFLEMGRKLLSTQVPCFHLCWLEISPLSPLSLGSRVQDFFKHFMENATGIYSARQVR